MAETYYDVLGVPADATQSEIEDAYRERVKETHPDLSDAEDAAERFQAVKEAHETLGDADERARYDRLGHGSYTTFGFGGGGSGDDEGVDGFGFDVGDPGGGTATGYDFGPDPYAGTETGDGRRSYDVSGAAWGDPGSVAGGETTAGETGDTRSDRWTASEETAGEGRETSRRHVRDDGSEGEQTDGGFTVHQWEDEPLETPTLGLTFTQDRGVVAAIVFVLYPVFLYSTVSPLFSTLTNVIVGICTLLTMGYLLALPELGLLVFGSWSVVAPIFLLFGPWNPVGPLALFVLAVCWIPFGYSLMVARVTRWS